MSGKITVEQLAKILQKEFEDWGDIDPYLFTAVLDGEDKKEPSDMEEQVYQMDVRSMRKTLENMVKELNKNK